MSLPNAAVNRAHVLVITARSHALAVLREIEEHGDRCGNAETALDTLAKQLDLIGDVLAGNECPLEDEPRSADIVPIRGADEQ